MSYNDDKETSMESLASLIYEYINNRDDELGNLLKVRIVHRSLLLESSERSIWPYGLG